jgi:hypothetical protein
MLSIVVIVALVVNGTLARIASAGFFAVVLIVSTRIASFSVNIGWT